MPGLAMRAIYEQKERAKIARKLEKKLKVELKANLKSRPKTKTVYKNSSSLHIGSNKQPEEMDLASTAIENLIVSFDRQVTLPTTMSKSVVDVLKDGGADVVLFAHLKKEDKRIQIARPIRSILGINFIGNLPWEHPGDYLLMKRLVDEGIFTLEGKTTKQSADGQYADFTFNLTKAGLRYAEQLLESDPKWIVDNQVKIAGLVSMLFCSIVQRNPTAAWSVKINSRASNRIQRLVDTGLLNVERMELDFANNAYVIQFGASENVTKFKEAAQKINWFNGYRLSVADGVDYLNSETEEIIHPVIPLVPVKGRERLASRIGRGGFGMSSKTFGRVSEGTSFRKSLVNSGARGTIALAALSKVDTTNVVDLTATTVNSAKTQYIVQTNKQYADEKMFNIRNMYYNKYK